MKSEATWGGSAPLKRRFRNRHGNQKRSGIKKAMREWAQASCRHAVGGRSLYRGNGGGSSGRGKSLRGLAGLHEVVGGDFPARCFNDAGNHIAAGPNMPPADHRDVSGGTANLGRKVGLPDILLFQELSEGHAPLYQFDLTSVKLKLSARCHGAHGGLAHNDW